MFEIKWNKWFLCKHPDLKGIKQFFWINVKYNHENWKHFEHPIKNNFSTNVPMSLYHRAFGCTNRCILYWKLNLFQSFQFIIWILLLLPPYYILFYTHGCLFSIDTQKQHKSENVLVKSQCLFTCSGIYTHHKQTQKIGWWWRWRHPSCIM